MIKVLIADNDADNRKNFKTFIRSHNNAFQVVRTIDDSKDIENVVSETGVHLIIADIKFFGVSGFQRIKKLHENYKDVMLILYGTYSDTIYMEKSLEEGAITYIYKPVKPVDLTRCLNRAKTVFDEMNEKKRDYAMLLKSFEENIPLFEDRFLINLVHGHINNESEIKDTFNYFGMKLLNRYTVFIVKIDHYKQIFLSLSQKERHILIFTILNKIIDRLTEIDNGTAFINHFNSVTVLLGGDMALDELLLFCEEIKDMIRSELEISVSVGIGKTYPNAVSIPVSYREAKSALRYNFCMGYNCVIHIQYVEPENDITYRYPLKKEELLVYSAVIGDIESVTSHIDEIFTVFKNIDELSISHIQKIILDILVSINRYASEKKSILEQSFARFFSIAEISNITTLDQGYIYLKTTLSKFCEFVNDERRQRSLTLLKDAKAHIDINYFMNISLTKIAAKLGTTPDYLNKLFLDCENKTYFDYAIGVRLSVAKKLLANEDLSEEVIAASLGYDDVKHFRSIFQKYEGISIDEYKIKIKKD